MGLVFARVGPVGPVWNVRPVGPVAASVTVSVAVTPSGGAARSYSSELPMA
jgi:hypothetical protein